MMSLSQYTEAYAFERRKTLEESKRSEHRPQFQPIYKSTGGVIFLGTPHGGSSAANWGLIASKLVSFALQGTNENILRALRPDGEILENLRKQFLKMLEDRVFNIHSFYEKKGISGVSGF